MSNMLTSFWASHSFCSSVISSMGFGIGSSTWPVMGLMLEQKDMCTLLMHTHYCIVSSWHQINNNHSQGFCSFVFLCVRVFIFRVLSLSSPSCKKSSSHQESRCVSISCVLQQVVYYKTPQIHMVAKLRINVFCGMMSRAVVKMCLNAAHRFLCRGQRETLQPSASHPCRRVSLGEPTCSWWWCRSLAWSSHLSVGEVPGYAEIIGKAKVINICLGSCWERILFSRECARQMHQNHLWSNLLVSSVPELWYICGSPCGIWILQSEGWAPESNPLCSWSPAWSDTNHRHFTS